MVVPGTPRDTLHVLDTLLNLDAGPKSEMVNTDAASHSNMIFGLSPCSVIGSLHNSPTCRTSGTGVHRCPTDHETGIELSTDRAAITGYGPLEPIARNTVNLTEVATQ
jgi:hypothetical protein